ncbi:MAG: transglycosylase SLT domain-containing protein [Pseudomonadales bacterium]
MFRKLAACLVIMSNWTATASNAGTLTEPVATPQYELRSEYVQAKDAIKHGRRGDYARHRANLDDYLLAPYLDYHDLRARMGRAKSSEVTSYLQKHAELPIAPLLKHRWLRSLGSNRQWSTFLKHHDPAVQRSAEMQCYRLRALYGSKQKEQALAGVSELWTVGKSQPKACDPIFDVWIDGGGLTELRVWERLGLALKANERTLARYLIGLLGDSSKPLGQTYYGAHTRPERAHAAALLKKDTVQTREIVMHAAERLLRRDKSEDAEELWNERRHWQFNDEQRQMFRDALLVSRATHNIYPAPDAPDITESVIARLALTAIQTMDWEQAYHWIERLPAETKASSQWQYWLARALQETHGMTERVTLAYAALAGQRHYYGFLAAERIESPPMLNNEAFEPDPQVLHRLRKRADLARALELYAVDEQIAAKREWLKLIPKLEPEDQANAAYLAREVGWLRQSIHAANAAGLHNDLTVRFPVAHMVEFRRMSHTTGVPLTMLLAVTRQESAFDPNARSHANARGLMQLLPTTAEWVARRAKLSRPTNTALYRPSTNIEIASHYLAMLLQRYNGSRPLAAAAYNAGERRVDRWIKERSGEPMDVWIENIPFKETRNYVQNVLAFSQVYAQKLNANSATLSAAEAQVPAVAPQLGR